MRNRSATALKPATDSVGARARQGRALNVAATGAAPRRSTRVRLLSAALAMAAVTSVVVLGTATPAAADYAADCRTAAHSHQWHFELVYGVPAYTTGSTEFFNGDYCQIGKAKLIMQRGDLFVYDERGVIRWRASWENSRVNGYAQEAVMQLDGNFVLYDGAGQAQWASNTYTGLEGRLAVQADGNVVVYTPGWRPGWSSRSAH
jgi:hypothetical protein